MISKLVHHVRRFIYLRTVRQLAPIAGGIGANGQDLFVAKMLGNKQSGVFVDIGANDGVKISNTLYFERELGWSGLAVEPLPCIFEKLQSNRRCHVLNACISDKEGKSCFLEVVGASNMLSGLASKLDPRHVRRIHKNIRRQGGTVHEIEVETTTWEVALSKYLIKCVDFLSLDTEGGELDILRSIDFVGTPVRVISVENNYFTHKICRFLETKGFERCGAFGVDEIYCHRSVAGG